MPDRQGFFRALFSALAAAARFGVRQDGAMTFEAGLRGIIVSLPDAPLDDCIGVVEVLIQEGFATFAMPVEARALAEVLAIFGSRARFGATRVTSAAQVVSAAEAGAGFVLADAGGAEVADAASQRGLTCFLSAMTPTEVRAVLKLPDVGALLYPADVVGHAMGARLAELGLVERIIPMGGIGAYAAGEWMKFGAPAVCIDSTLLGDAFDGGSLSQLRDRCSSFVAIDRRHRHD